MRALERGIATDSLDDVLAIVEHAADGNVEYVCVLQRIHLRTLERAHLAVRRQHEHADALAPAHRVFRRRSGVARSGAEDVQRASFPLKHVFEHFAEQLHGDILERQRRSIGQLQQMQAGLQCLQRRDVDRTKHFAAVGAVHQRAQIVFRDIVDVTADDGKSQIGV